MKYLLYFSLLMLGFTACQQKQVAEGETVEPISEQIVLSQEQLKSAGVQMDTLQMKAVKRTIRASGRVEAPPQNYISVSAPLGGFLRSTELLPGMKVKKGSVLAWMEDQQYVQLQEQFLVAKSELTMIEKEFLRQKELNVDKAASDKSLEQAKGAWESKKAQLAGLREKLKLAGIQPDQLTDNNLSRSVPLLSPIDGYVVKINVNVGKYVQPQDALFELVNPDDIHLALTIFEKDVEFLKEGQLVTAWTNHGQSKYNCEVILLGRNIDADRSTDVHCHFLNYDHSLLPGMFMNAEISVESHNGLVLPEEAVVEYQGKNYVFVGKDNTAFKLEEVTKGTVTNGYAELLNASELRNKPIAVKGAYSLLMSVKNKNEE